MAFPCYSESLLSVTASILNYYGAQSCHKSLRALDKVLESNPQNVVLMVLDGMGSQVLFKHMHEASFLRQNLLTSISSVFPPTTTAATTTLESGLSPIEHGWLGWCLYFSEIDDTVDIFTGDLSYKTGCVTEYNLAKTHLPYKTMYEKIEAAGGVRAHSLSPFSQEPCPDIASLCSRISQLCKNGKNYIYAYCTNPDYDLHRLGGDAQRVREFLEDTDKQLTELVKGLKNTLLIITADHGHRDVQWLFLEDYEELFSLLRQPPSLEPRAMCMYIKPGCEGRFKELFLKSFSRDFILFTRQEALSTGLFGPGTPHQKANELLGDFIAVATGPYCLQYRRIEGDIPFKSHHAGLSSEELNVPLILKLC